MSPAARSILVYSIYLFGQGLTLLIAPNIALRIFGLPETSEVWVRIVGMTVFFFAIYYVVAARNEFRPFFAVSVATRLSVVAFFAALHRRRLRDAGTSCCSRRSTSCLRRGRGWRSEDPPQLARESAA